MCRSVYSSGEMVRFTLPGENRMRRESSVPDVTHNPPRPLGNGFGHWSGDKLVHRFCLYGLVCLDSVRYGWVWRDTVRFGLVRLGTVGILSGSVVYGSSIVCVCPGAA